MRFARKVLALAGLALACAAPGCGEEDAETLPGLIAEEVRSRCDETELVFDQRSEEPSSFRPGRAFAEDFANSIALARSVGIADCAEGGDGVRYMTFDDVDVLTRTARAAPRGDLLCISGKTLLSGLVQGDDGEQFFRRLCHLADGVMVGGNSAVLVRRVRASELPALIGRLRSVAREVEHAIAPSRGLWWSLGGPSPAHTVLRGWVHLGCVPFPSRGTEAAGVRAAVVRETDTRIEVSLPGLRSTSNLLCLTSQPVRIVLSAPAGSREIYDSGQDPPELLWPKPASE